MKKRRFPWLLLAGILLLALIPARRMGEEALDKNIENEAETLFDTAKALLSGEPPQVRALRKKELVQKDEGRQEYYFSLLNDREKRGYREMLEGIRAREMEIYLTISEDEVVDKVYHALLKDHPELFWVHNRRQVYKTTFSGGDYCRFSPGYSYTEEETKEIQKAAENACREVEALLPEQADAYEKIKTVYTYLIDTVEYKTTEHDQSIAGAFWKKEAVCAGYAGAMQYLLEYLQVPCIYTEGSAKGSTEGHAWNIVEIDGQYYYADATNGDQPDFLEGDAATFEEHKTILYDYLCPFPEEYEEIYTPSPEFPVPDCSAVDKNFYVMNNGCFDTYDPQALLAYCKMRLDNGAAVVRFKFSTPEAFGEASARWIASSELQEAARYYMGLYGKNQVEYHYGILENMKTMYFMF